MKTLVILESPTKASKVTSFLKQLYPNEQFKVLASAGHIRELAKDGEYNFGIDTKNMIPRWVITKPEIVDKLAEIGRDANRIILATDGDREGEAIAYHLYDVLFNINQINVEYKRIRLNSISIEEVAREMENLSNIDNDLVNAANTRVMLDKIYGFLLSPLVQAATGGKSAGRVQSAGLIILALIEKEISNFAQSIKYVAEGKINNLVFKNYILEDKKRKENFLSSKEEVAQIVKETKKTKGIVDSIVEKPYEKNEFVPFSTADLLQKAKTKLGFKVKDISKMAQELFENGLVTYIRTDSNKLSPEFEQELNEYVIKTFGGEALGTLKNVKVDETAQEGHPAITPVYLFKNPQWIELNKTKYEYRFLTEQHIQLYNLIYQNTINSVLIPMTGTTTQVSVKFGEHQYLTAFKTISDYGYLKYNLDLEKPESIENIFQEKMEFSFDKLATKEIKSKPKTRYNEATLIKALKNAGIGRPATYAKAVEVNLLRKYVELDKKDSFIVTSLGLKVYEFLKQSWSDIINLHYTKELEEQLDQIAAGKIEHLPFLKEVFADIEKRIIQAYKILDTNAQKCQKCSIGIMKPVITKDGKNFMGCSNYPNCRNLMLTQAKLDTLENCPKCQIGKLVIAKKKSDKTLFQRCHNDNCNFVNWNYEVKKKS